MHRIWLAEEVVHYIFDLIGRANVSRLGRTCIRLFDIALDHVWDEIDDVSVLFDILRVNDAAAADDIGLKRLRLYAARIRRLELKEPERNDTPPRSYEYIPDPAELFTVISPASLFIALRELHITVKSVEGAARAVQYAIPNISYLRLNIDCTPYFWNDEDERQEMTAEDGPLLLSNLSKLPKVDELRICKWQTDPTLLSRISDELLDIFPGVTTFTTTSSNLSVNILRKIGTLSKLEHLDMQLMGTLRTLPSMPLTTLRSLRAVFISSQQCLSLLSILEAPDLMALSCHLIAEDSPEDLKWISLLIKNRYPKVSRLSIFWFDPTLRGTTAQTPFSIVQPLLSCRALKHLSIRVLNLSLAITDEDMFLLAQCFPSLQKLDLAGIPETNAITVRTRTLITLAGLRALALHCASLRTLSIRVALRHPPDISQIEPEPSKSDLYFLDVQDSPPCESVIAALALAKLFPRLDTFKYAHKNLLHPGAAFRIYDNERVRCMQDILRRLQL